MEIIMRRIKNYPLDFDKTLPYFLEQLKAGNSLSNQVKNELNLKNGSFFTLLPNDIEINKLYEFSLGGIISPIPYGDQAYFIENSSQFFYPQQVITMDHELSKFIADFISKKISHYAIVENVISELYDPHINVDNVHIRHYKNEVYYLLNKTNSVDEIYKVIRKSSLSWYFFAILTNIKKTLSSNLPWTKDDFDQICENVQFLVLGAYDGEGYVFWEKTLTTNSRNL